MSDNNNPLDLGVLEIGEFAPISGVLNFTNPQDVFLFETPEFRNEPEDGVSVFDILGFITVSRPTRVTLGQDFNNDGIFDPSTEQIGQTLLVNSDQVFLLSESFSQGSINIFDSGNYLEPEESYFLSVSSPNLSFSNQSYEITGSLNSAVIGEITTDDDSYRCDDDRLYYFDKYTDDLIGEDIRVGNAGLEVGDVVSIVVLTNEFDPVVFLFDENECSILDFDATTEVISIGQQDYLAVQVDFTMRENTTYGITVETLNSETTGQYYVTVDF
jgi:hypothetical protein